LRSTIRDVASRANVSVNTVSRVLNNKGEISQQTKERVLDAIRDLNFRPNTFARSLQGKQSLTIGQIVTDCINPNNAQQIRAVQNVTARQGYSVLLVDTNEQAEREIAAVDIMVEKFVDGFLITPLQYDNKHLARLHKEGRVPFVLTNRAIDELADVDTVLHNNYAGAYAATQHLIGLGHRRIAYLTARRQVWTVEQRLLGYKAALNEAELLYNEELVVQINLSLESAFEATKYLLTLPPNRRPTAIFAYNDFMAVGVIKALKEAGVKVPDDMALVGYDDIIYAQFLEIPLTTVRQPTQKLGEVAAEVLLERIARRDTEVKRIVLEPELIIRASSHPTSIAG
jgi:LacI family transcriptional regulator